MNLLQACRIIWRLYSENKLVVQGATVEEAQQLDKALETIGEIAEPKNDRR